MNAGDSHPLDDLLSVRLQLRPDVRCALHENAGEPYCQIEDPLTSNFYRLGVREWQLARALDGVRPLREHLEMQRRANDDSLTDEEAVVLGRWLVQTQLATADGFRHPLFIRAAQDAPKLLRFNPVFIRVPLFNPDRLLARLAPWFLWSITPLAVVIWCAIVLFALYQLGLDWDRFREPMNAILAPDNWAYLLSVWIVLKVLHEFYHGLVCKKYGGRVPTCGLLFILFSPVAFVDVTSSWRFRSKWQRIFTAAAGMYIEILVAALATFLWAWTDDPLLSQLAHNVIVTASISTLLFNANCLMRFDGYYILSDLLGIQNLYVGGQQYLRCLCRRYLLGVSAKPVARGTRLAWVFKLYGPASLMWRVSFYIGILLAAATMFRGAGVILSLVVATLWLGIPGFKFLVYLSRGAGNEQPNRLRCLGILGATAGALWAAMLLPWPGGIVATGVVDYDPLAVIRAETAGFLRFCHVEPGQVVEPGQPLVTIENHQTVFDLTSIQHAIEQSEIRLRTLQEEKKYDQCQDEAKNLQSLRESQQELQANVESLEISAPTRGRIIARDLDSRVGQYLQSGERVLAVGREDRKSIMVSVAQKDADFFLRQLGTTPRVRIKGRMAGVSQAALTRVNPRATNRLFHPALAAPNGGPLAVTANPLEQHADPDDNFELVEPHFLATVSLPADQSTLLRAGELARVRLDAIDETIGQHLWGNATRWVRKQLYTP